MLRSNRIVVLGAAGHVGSHLVDLLLYEGYEVVGVDSFVTGRERNIAHLKNHPSFFFYEKDICHSLTASFSGAVEEIGAVFHLASPASPVDFFRRPLEIMRANSIGTENALELALKKNAVFVLASTSEIYGEPLEHPQRETYWGNVNPIGPRAVYDEAKRFAEAMTMAYKRMHNLDVRIARLFNTYGPRMRPDDGRVVSEFVCQALDKRPLTVFGRGEQTRSFCFVEDTAEGLYDLLCSTYTLPVNIGSEVEITIKEFALLVLQEVGSDNSIEFKELPENDPKQRKPDISVARNILGWEPRTKLLDGLRKTIAWFKENR